MSDIVAEYTQNWLEDNISEGLYESGYETVSKYQQTEEFETQVVSMFTSYLNTRMESFQSQIDKLKLEETE